MKHTCLSGSDGRGFVKHLTNACIELHGYHGGDGFGFVNNIQACNVLHVYQILMDVVL